MLPNILITLIQIIVIFGAGKLMLPLLGFGELSLSDPGALLAISVSIAFCSSSLGLCIASIARTESQISTLGAVILWIMGAVSGAFIPQFFLGDFLGAIGKVIPHYWAISAYRDILVRAQGFSGIIKELGIIWIFTIFFSLIGLWRFRFANKE